VSARIAHALDRLATLREDPRTPILLVIAGGWSLSLGVRLVYPAIIPHLRTAYGISLSTAGLLLTVLWLAYAIGQLPGGILADRLGERRVLVASTFISGATLGLVVVAGAVEVLFAATVLFGLSTALYGVARFTILTEVYPDNDGTAIGVTMAAGDLGNAVLPPFAGFLAVTFAWQFGFAFAVPLFLLAGVGLFVALPRSDRQRAMASSDDAPEEPWLTRTAATVRRVASALRSRPVAVVTAIQTLGYCAWQALTGFYPTYLIDVKGFAPTTATLLFGGFFALGVVVKPPRRSGLRRLRHPHDAAGHPRGRWCRARFAPVRRLVAGDPPRHAPFKQHPGLLDGDAHPPHGVVAGGRPRLRARRPPDGIHGDRRGQPGRRWPARRRRPV